MVEELLASCHPRLENADGVFLVAQTKTDSDGREYITALKRRLLPSHLILSGKFVRKIKDLRGIAIIASLGSCCLDRPV